LELLELLELPTPDFEANIFLSKLNISRSISDLPLLSLALSAFQLDPTPQKPISLSQQYA